MRSSPALDQCRPSWPRGVPRSGFEARPGFGTWSGLGVGVGGCCGVRRRWCRVAGAGTGLARGLRGALRVAEVGVRVRGQVVSGVRGGRAARGPGAGRGVDRLAPVGASVGPLPEAGLEKRHRPARRTDRSCYQRCVGAPEVSVEVLTSPGLPEGAAFAPVSPPMGFAGPVVSVEGAAIAAGVPGIRMVGRPWHGRRRPASPEL